MSTLEQDYAEAAAALEAGEPLKALSCLSTHLGEDPAVDLLVVEACWRLGDLVDAEAALERASSAFDSDDPELAWWRAELQLSRWELEPALQAWRAIAEAEPHADAFARLALAEDLAGDTAASDRAWAAAVASDPSTYAPYADLDEAGFDAVVEAALAELQPKYGRFLGNVRVIREPLPFLELVDPSDPAATPPDLLGLFVGPTLSDLAEDVGAELPPAVYLFERNLLRSFGRRDELEREIRTTLFHEVGHLLGLDEDEVEALGLG